MRPDDDGTEQIGGQIAVNLVDNDEDLQPEKRRVLRSLNEGETTVLREAQQGLLKVMILASSTSIGPKRVVWMNIVLLPGLVFLWHRLPA
ncbi:MAG: hypothetical protein KAY37_02105, partial [Phycisphaerae bacterium]|nr:hypothetical protein [Phycisphaerae bacterium]